MNARLDAKVAAVNAANALANDLGPKLAAVFAPFLGAKIVKADGYFTAKAFDAMPPLPDHCYRHVTPYAFGVYAKTCVSDGAGGCAYHETYVPIGELRDRVFVKPVATNGAHRTDYTAAEIEAKRAAVDAAEAALRAAQNALFPFDR